MNKKVLAGSAVVALAFSLSACSAPANNVEDCIVGGETVALVKTGTDLTKAPNPDFPYPLKAENTQTKFTIVGDGPQVEEHQIIKTRISIYSGQNGNIIYDGNHSQMDDPLFLLVNESTLVDSQFGVTYESLLCANVGSRFVVTTPANQVFSDQETAALGLENSDALVFLYDIVDSLLAKADGTDRLVTHSGLPSVALATDGTPGLTFRGTSAPTEQTVVVLKHGSHQRVSGTDAVAIHQTTWSWVEESVIDTTWTGKTPTVMTLGSDDKELIPDEVIQDYPIGSQLMIVTPDSESGDASIVVVDILGKL